MCENMFYSFIKFVYMPQVWAGFGTLLLVGCLRVTEPDLSPHRYKRTSNKTSTSRSWNENSSGTKI